MIINSDHRGRTVTGRYTYRSLIQLEPADFLPDSIYWKIQAKGTVAKLIEEVGTDEATDWFDTVFPEGTNPSWKEIAEEADKKLHDLSIAKEQEKS